MGITSPVIVAVDTHAGVSFFNAVDDIALKANGLFADALQSLMEVIYVFYLFCDRQTTNITYFCKSLVGFAPKNIAGRQILINMLFPPTSSTQVYPLPRSSQQLQLLPSDAQSTPRATRKRPHSTSLRQSQPQMQPLVELESPTSSPH